MRRLSYGKQPNYATNEETQESYDRIPELRLSLNGLDYMEN